MRTLQTKIKNCKRDMKDYDERLLMKIPAKSGAERESKRRKIQGKRKDLSGAERQARRKSVRTTEQVEKERAVVV